MMDVFNSWKTTVAGLVGAVLPLANSLMPMVPPEYAALASFVVMGMGLVASKDADK